MARVQSHGRDFARREATDAQPQGVDPSVLSRHTELSGLETLLARPGCFVLLSTTSASRALRIDGAALTLYGEGRWRCLSGTDGYANTDGF